MGGRLRAARIPCQNLAHELHALRRERFRVPKCDDQKSLRRDAAGDWRDQKCFTQLAAKPVRPSDSIEQSFELFVHFRQRAVKRVFRRGTKHADDLKVGCSFGRAFGKHLNGDGTAEAAPEGSLH